MRLKFTNILPLLLSLLACSSCVYDKFGVCPGDDIVLPGEEQYVNLDLKIAINDGEAPGSRAFYTDKDGTFEKPESKYELVHTLRVVIVRENGDIEHNRMVTVREDFENNLIQSGDIINDNLRFNVVAGEKKQIYLFANEKAVDYDFSSLKEKFPTDEIANILIKREKDEAFIDNSGDGHKTYVPMSEFFDVEIPEFDEIPELDGETINNTVTEKFLKKTLFITRSLIKFSFSIVLDAAIDNAKLDLYGITISNLANNGYYLPNNTKYSYDPNPETNPLGGRLITSFDTPKDVTFSDYTFKFKSGENEWVNITNTEQFFSPMIYLPESKLSSDNNFNDYKVTLDFKDPDLNKIYGSESLDITDIPRNTHVKINITLKEADMEVEVRVAPYIGVTLDPIFGNDNIVKPPKPRTETE